MFVDNSMGRSHPSQSTKESIALPRARKGLHRHAPGFSVSGSIDNPKAGVIDFADLALSIGRFFGPADGCSSLAGSHNGCGSLPCVADPAGIVGF
jgi:hypothetical protein